jgi:SAM-dependent methyltransferase
LESVETHCVICKTQGNSETIYDANIDSFALSAKVFSARRLPDRIHYRWVRCKTCRLYRSDPILKTDLSVLYKESTFDYSSEVSGIARTYIQITMSALKPNIPQGSVLEVGGGNGFYLEAALESGFSETIAVEPSIQAVNKSRPDIRNKTIVGVMESGLVESDSQDLVAMFHVMDHLPEPLETLRSCVEALKPGGTLVVAVHNINSWSARLLRSKSPIIDIEHTYLYSRSTGEHLFTMAGLTDIKSHSYRNHHSVAYLLHLTPFPKKPKEWILNSFLGRICQKLQVSVPLGNIWISGKKRM